MQRAKAVMLAPIPKLGGRQVATPAMPFSTPGEVLTRINAGLPKLDLSRMTKAGMQLRAAPGPSSAGAIGFALPTGSLTPRSLRDAFAKIDVGPLKLAGAQPKAVFDFDNTLFAGDVFQPIIEMMIERSAFPKGNAAKVAQLFERASNGKVSAASLAGMSTTAIMKCALTSAREHQVSLSALFVLTCTAITGMRERDLNAIAIDLFEKGLTGGRPYKELMLQRDGVSTADLVNVLAERGVESHIVTLGVPLFTRIGARYLGIPPDRVYGSELEVRNGRFTGRVIDIAKYGKHVACTTYVGSSTLFAFGDKHETDTAMLQLASAAAFAVNPLPVFDQFMERQGADLHVVRFT